MDTAVIASLVGACISFFLILFKEFYNEYKQAKLLAWAIYTELAEIKVQFSGVFIENLRKNREIRAFSQTNYTENYTGVFDSNVIKLGHYNHIDTCKIVSAYMVVKSYFDTLRTISSAFDTHLDMIKNNPLKEPEITDAGLKHYDMIEDQHTDMIKAIDEAFKILVKYKEMNFMQFLTRKII